MKDAFVNDSSGNSGAFIIALCLDLWPSDDGQCLYSNSNKSTSSSVGAIGTSISCFSVLLLVVIGAAFRCPLGDWLWYFGRCRGRGKQ